MASLRWKFRSSSRQPGERRALTALALGFLAVSWLPLSAQALSAAWSALHPVSGGQLVRNTTASVPRPVPTFWRIPWK
jgi:hypothetical protein